jgi:hypothetical protein
MLMSIILFVGSHLAARADDHVFSMGKVFVADGKLKEVGVGPVDLDSGEVELQFASNIAMAGTASADSAKSGSGAPVVFQPKKYSARVHFRRASSEIGKSTKRIIFSYERLDVTSGKAAGSDVRTDSFGPKLSDAVFVMKIDEKGMPEIEDFEELKAGLTKKIGDATTMAILENSLNLVNIDLFQFLSPASGCLNGYIGASPGKKWKNEAHVKISEIKYNCSFTGWSKVKEKKIAILSAVTPVQTIKSLSPNGGEVAMNIKEDGKIYFEPSSREFFGEFKAGTTVSNPASGAVFFNGTKSLVGHAFGN